MPRWLPGAQSLVRAGSQTMLWVADIMHKPAPTGGWLAWIERSLPKL
ncbi:MAG: hypothetical protein VKJ46_01270 [Leptolyngbyaceae bacterium]|nr:hypothetical protein [Leptolyngbyaceae bacterium]